MVWSEGGDLGGRGWGRSSHDSYGRILSGEWENRVGLHYSKFVEDPNLAGCDAWLDVVILVECGAPKAVRLEVFYHQRSKLDREILPGEGDVDFSQGREPGLHVGQKGKLVVRKDGTAKLNGGCQADEGNGGTRIKGNVKGDAVVVCCQYLAVDGGDTVEGGVVFQVWCQGGVEEGCKGMWA